MRASSCPNCQHEVVRWLEASSKDAWVNYFRCGRCGHVWSVRKDSNAAPRDVTYPTDEPQGNDLG